MHKIGWRIEHTKSLDLFGLVHYCVERCQVNRWNLRPWCWTMWTTRWAKVDLPQVKPHPLWEPFLSGRPRAAARSASHGQNLTGNQWLCRHLETQLSSSFLLPEGHRDRSDVLALIAFMGVLIAEINDITWGTEDVELLIQAAATYRETECHGWMATQ